MLDMNALREACDLLPFVNLPRNEMLALIELAEREQYRQTRQGTHWSDCWRVHDDCAAALWRGHKAVTTGTGTLPD